MSSLTRMAWAGVALQASLVVLNVSIGEDVAALAIFCIGLMSLAVAVGHTRRDRRRP